MRRELSIALTVACVMLWNVIPSHLASAKEEKKIYDVRRAWRAILHYPHPGPPRQPPLHPGQHSQPRPRFCQCDQGLIFRAP